VERKKEERAIESLVNHLKEKLGEKLLSVLVYGSFLTRDYRPGLSDINIVVIVSDLTAEDLFSLKKKIIPLATRYQLKPFFFTPEFVRRSTDSFPLEWQAIKNCHRVIYGQDLVETLLINREDMRRQLEREIKQNYLNFQQGLLFRRNPREVLTEALKSWKILERHLTEIVPHLKEKLPPVNLALPDRRDVAIRCEEYLAFLKKLVELIDRTGQL